MTKAVDFIDSDRIVMHVTEKEFRRAHDFFSNRRPFHIDELLPRAPSNAYVNIESLSNCCDCADQEFIVYFRVLDRDALGIKYDY